MEELTIKLVETEEQMEAAMGMRFRVFVGEQQVAAEVKHRLIKRWLDEEFIA